VENKQPCKTCGATDYYFWRVVHAEGDSYESCSECSSGRMPSLSPDVYFDGSKGANQTDPNLVDRYTGPIPFSSKREKAAILKRLGLREAGDKEHGGRNYDRSASKQWDK
jgi:hypothetical protein